MSRKEIEAAAAAIRMEIDMLLCDYSGDEALILIEAQETAERIAIAQARLDVMDWLRASWSEKAATTEERLEGVAEAALEAAARARG